MGNILPKIVFEDILDRENQQSADFYNEATDEETRERQLCEIRRLNQQKSNVSSMRLRESAITIMEEVALEDLCQEAGYEADDVNDKGEISASQKNKVLEKLAQNAQTKKYFQTKETLQNYIDKKIYGDNDMDLALMASMHSVQSRQNQSVMSRKAADNQIETTVENLTVDYQPKQSTSNSDGLFNRPISVNQRDSNIYRMMSQNGRMSNNRGSNFSRNHSTYSSKIRQSNFSNMRQSNMRQSNLAICVKVIWVKVVKVRCSAEVNFSAQVILINDQVIITKLDKVEYIRW